MDSVTGKGEVANLVSKMAETGIRKFFFNNLNAPQRTDCNWRKYNCYRAILKM